MPVDKPSAPLFEPLVLTSTAPEGEEVELVELFRIDDKPYMIPSRPSAGLALEVVDDTIEHGPGVAEMLMLKRLIGDEAYGDLKRVPGLTGAHIAKLANAVTKLTLGALEDEGEGNS